MAFRYTVKGILGQGTFGQVVECVPDTATKAPVAVKVIKNQAAFYHQVTLLRSLHEPCPGPHLTLRFCST